MRFIVPKYCTCWVGRPSCNAGDSRYTDSQSPSRSTCRGGIQLHLYIYIYTTLYSLHRWASPSPSLHVSISPCFDVYVYVLCLDVSISPSPCLDVSMSLCPCLQVSGIPETENGTNGNQQLPFSFLQTENGNGKLQFVSANGNGKSFCRQTINRNRRLLFQRHAYLRVYRWRYIGSTG
jgi:hypothetical protein